MAGDEAAHTGATPSADSPTAATPTPGSSSTGPLATASTGPSDSSSTGGCRAAPASGKGVTDSQLKIAVMLIQIVGPAANSAFDIPPTDQQEKIFNGVIGSVNAEGGVACRKVVPRYYSVNPADQNDQQRKCIESTDAQPFVVLDPGAYSFTSPICFAQRRVPYFGGFFLTTKEARQGYPYLFNLANYDHLYRDTILGLRERGVFDTAKGFRKLGFFYRSCRSELVEQQFATMREAGLKDDQVVSYDLGCPQAFASPADLAQAVLKFQRAGVTHATSVYAYGDIANFTNVAEQQGFRPQYLLADDGITALSYGNLRPNPSNIVNALAVTAGRNGEERTPGLQPTAGTARCDAVMKANGLPPTYRQHQLAGNACNLLWMVKAATDNAPAVRAENLASGLQRAKSIDFSYPSAPNDFTGNLVTTGGQFWRTLQYLGDCECWRVIEPSFRRSFP